MRKNHDHVFRTAVVLLSALIMQTILFTDCMASEEKMSATGFYMDTYVTLTAYVEDEEILNDAFAECERYENLLSRTIENSDVWRINHAEGQPVEVSDDTVKILETAMEISKLSDGAFDVTIAPASSLWDFTSGKAELPDAAALEEAAAKVDYTRLQLDGNVVTLPAGMMIDLGGIAKGYVADAIKEYLIEVMKEIEKDPEFQADAKTQGMPIGMLFGADFEAFIDATEKTMIDMKPLFGWA